MTSVQRSLLTAVERAIRASGGEAGQRRSANPRELDAVPPSSANFGQSRVPVARPHLPAARADLLLCISHVGLVLYRVAELSRLNRLGDSKEKSASSLPEAQLSPAAALTLADAARCSRAGCTEPGRPKIQTVLRRSSRAVASLVRLRSLSGCRGLARWIAAFLLLTVMLSACGRRAPSNRVSPNSSLSGAGVTYLHRIREHLEGGTLSRGDSPNDSDEENRRVDGVLGELLGLEDSLFKEVVVQATYQDSPAIARVLLVAAMRRRAYDLASRLVLILLARGDDETYFLPKLIESVGAEGDPQRSARLYIALLELYRQGSTSDRAHIARLWRVSGIDDSKLPEIEKFYNAIANTDSENSGGKAKVLRRRDRAFVSVSLQDGVWSDDEDPVGFGYVWSGPLGVDLSQPRGILFVATSDLYPNDAIGLLAAYQRGHPWSAVDSSLGLLVGPIAFWREDPLVRDRLPQLVATSDAFRQVVVPAALLRCVVRCPGAVDASDEICARAFFAASRLLESGSALSETSTLEQFKASVEPSRFAASAASAELARQTSNVAQKIREGCGTDLGYICGLGEYVAWVEPTKVGDYQAIRVMLRTQGVDRADIYAITINASSAPSGTQIARVGCEVYSIAEKVATRVSQNAPTPGSGSEQVWRLEITDRQLRVPGLLLEYDFASDGSVRCAHSPACVPDLTFPSEQLASLAMHIWNADH